MPPLPINASNTPPTTTYTTIPISATDVIFRSVQNLSSTVSRLRPWPELIASGAFNRPDSFSTALTRLRTNFDYFRINYSIIISAFGALSLIGSPISLIILGVVFVLWLLLYFFREDPLVLFGYDVSDRLVLFGLVVVSFLGFWLSGGVGSLVVGIVIGVLVCGVHAVFRNSDGLFVEEEDQGAASASPLPSPSRPLIGSGSGSGSYSYGAVSSSGEFTK